MGSIAVLADDTNYRESKAAETHDQYLQKGVRHLCERGLTRIPTKYILPKEERRNDSAIGAKTILKLPIVDFTQLQDSRSRPQALNSLTKACEEFGVFQLINHGINDDVILRMTDVSKRFFDLPFDERSKYMSKDMASPARYGTSFNQNNDKVFCWRDFLKLSCNPLSDSIPSWPSSPVDLRETVVNYSKNINFLYLKLMEAVLESLGLKETTKSLKSEKTDTRTNTSNEFEDGSQLIVMNCYPACPEPDLTLGMPPHSDYGILTLLLQDEVEGLQIQHQGKWVTVEPLPNSFIVNVGDHLEIFSNGRYKSVLHRVVVNSSMSRVSVASLHSLPFDTVVRPSHKLVNEANPPRYRDTDFANFLEYIASCEHQRTSKSFLESRKLDD
ncbi:probable 2-oxoglutarate-dependent dioxygenase SLC1 [Argentina anserina]|uniref:probable 2-oxoglutarate-dependent dioxygenase SLC1 n=1 Tax=Argentina anserina TaxID=57926 RepID=UPI00217683E3|nr:probable 2-oxoglutarate-dependent dioxygenase SLC1 [Potentilla anserina]